ncbi:hypothetical protein ABG067_000984 [Albugo candida]
MTSQVDLTSIFAQSELHFGKTKNSDTIVEATESKKVSEELKSNAIDTVQSDVNVDSDPSMEKKKTKKKKSKTHDIVEADSVEESADNNEKCCRTVFVGNVSLEASSKKLSQHFSSCGEIESVRFRSVPIAGCAVDQHGNQKLMMKVCANKKILNNAKDFANAYIAFLNAESVPKALELSGTLRLKGDTEKPVLNVRIIRDRNTGLGKGFGYVRFRNAGCVPKALSINGKKFDGRELRVTVCGKRFKNKKGENQLSKKMQREIGTGAVSRIRMKRKVTQDKYKPKLLL